MHSNPLFHSSFSPLKISVYGILVWLLLFVMAPLQTTIPVNNDAILFLILSYIALWLGFAIGKNFYLFRAVRKNDAEIQKQQVTKLFYIVVALAIMGTAIRLLEVFLLRGISFSQGAMDNRVSMEESGYGMLSVISAILSSFGFLPIFIYYQFKMKKSFIWRFIALLLFFAPTLDILLLGSRSGVFVIVMMFCMYAIYFRKIRISPKRIVFIAGIAFIFLLFSTHIYVRRTVEFTGEDEVYKHILYRSSVNFTLEPTDNMADALLNSKNRIEKYLYLSYFNVAQYYTHGILEFFYLFDNFDNDHSLGSYTFIAYHKLFAQVFGLDPNIGYYSTIQPRNGVYTSFFGPLYVDFEWGTLLFVLLFGFLQMRIFKLSKQGHHEYTPLYFYFLIIDFFIPVFNFINGAKGIYLITSFVVFIFIYTLSMKKIILNSVGNKNIVLKIIS
ncbi:O-antigen polymerase [Fulvivirgaceae bacterium BMA12]|uniref:O-antigen polymerase n=1 Tax=Agaribacillus aureus TaxID=3051825 RepID=A0ABT8LD20_9BACT|nr:O-antigen polymerase [Fulvivirgaceae bacterium BMA12]